jgi:hypothetical protein
MNDEVDLLGKRGPQPRHGGRPIVFNDAYHREHRRRMQKSRDKQREKERLKNG